MATVICDNSWNLKVLAVLLHSILIVLAQGAAYKYVYKWLGIAVSYFISSFPVCEAWVYQKLVKE